MLHEKKAIFIFLKNEVFRPNLLFRRADLKNCDVSFFSLIKPLQSEAWFGYLFQFSHKKSKAAALLFQSGLPSTTDFTIKRLDRSHHHSQIWLDRPAQMESYYVQGGLCCIGHRQFVLLCKSCCAIHKSRSSLAVQPHLLKQHNAADSDWYHTCMNRLL